MADKKITLTEEELNELLLKKIEEMKKDNEVAVNNKPCKKNKQGAITDDWLEERVLRKYFYDGVKYVDDIHATVNGYTFCIPRGVDVMIPRYVADMIDASEQQMIYANSVSDKYEREFLAKAKEF